MKLLKKLCDLNGISGREDEVRAFILKEIDGFCEAKVDKLGNIIATKNGVKTPANKLMISAHMDEVGMIVTAIKSDGSLSIAPVGGVDPMVVIGRQVVVLNGGKALNGVIGAKAIHHLSTDERKTPPTFEQLFVDIGAASKEEAQKSVSLGDSVCFDAEFLSLGEGKLIGKAIDDRLGCAIMIELIKEDLPFDTTFVFTVQEEVGTRGATAAAFTVAPDISIVLESTTAADIPSAKEEKRVCELGKGAVVSYMDRSTIYDKELYMLAFETAAAENIAIQTKTMVAGGNDSGAIHLSRGGVRAVSISAPTRYLHSPSCVIAEADFDACRDLAKALIVRFGELEKS